MEKPLDAVKELEKVHAIVRNRHFVYTSGRHGSVYVNKDAIYPHTQLTRELCLQLAKHFQSVPVDVVAAPVLGGIILSQWVAFHLSQLQGREVLGVYAEKKKDNSGFEFRRGYSELVSQKSVLVVEDILNTGASVTKLIQELTFRKANIVGVGALCNRGKISSSTFGLKTDLYSLIELNLETFEPSNCPLCKNNTPLETSLGKGSNF